MTSAFRKLCYALLVSVVLQLSLAAPVDAAHGSAESSHARRSLSLKKRALVDRSDNRHSPSRKVAKDGLFGDVLGESLASVPTLLGIRGL